MLKKYSLCSFAFSPWHFVIRILLLLLLVSFDLVLSSLLLHLVVLLLLHLLPLLPIFLLHTINCLQNLWPLQKSRVPSHDHVSIDLTKKLITFSLTTVFLCSLPCIQQHLIFNAKQIVIDKIENRFLGVPLGKIRKFFFLQMTRGIIVQNCVWHLQIFFASNHLLSIFVFLLRSSMSLIDLSTAGGLK